MALPPARLRSRLLVVYGRLRLPPPKGQPTIFCACPRRTCVSIRARLSVDRFREPKEAYMSSRETVGAASDVDAGIFCGFPHRYWMILFQSIVIAPFTMVSYIWRQLRGTAFGRPAAFDLLPCYRAAGRAVVHSGATCVCRQRRRQDILRSAKKRNVSSTVLFARMF